MGVDFGYQGQLKNVFKDITETLPEFAGLSHNQLANEGATPIKFAASDLSKINRADLAERLAGQVAKINREVAVDHAPLTAKAGSRLHQRYVQITRRSEMLTPSLPQAAEGEPAKVLMFPA